MEDKTSVIREEFKKRIESVKSSEEIEQLRVEYLGKKGHVQGLMGQLKAVPNEEKKILRLNKASICVKAGSS